MEDARQNNTLGRGALTRLPTTNRTVHTEVALQAAEQNEKILGRPIKDLDLNQALKTNATNYDGVRDSVYGNLAGEFDRQDETEARKRDLSFRMEEQGRIRVEEEKERIAENWRLARKIGLWVLFAAGVGAALYFGWALILPAIVTAFRAAGTLRKTVVATQKSFEVMRPADGARLANTLSRSMDDDEKHLVKKIKADAYVKGEIETVSVPEDPPGDKPPLRSDP